MDTSCTWAFLDTNMSCCTPIYSLFFVTMAGAIPFVRACVYPSSFRCVFYVSIAEGAYVRRPIYIYTYFSDFQNKNYACWKRNRPPKNIYVDDQVKSNEGDSTK